MVISLWSKELVLAVDLSGGKFDVSIVQVRKGVMEFITAEGNIMLGVVILILRFLNIWIVNQWNLVAWKIIGRIRVNFRMPWWRELNRFELPWVLIVMLCWLIWPTQNTNTQNYRKKMVLEGQGQSITNSNTATSQAFNWTSSTSIPCKSPPIPPSNMTYPFPDPLVTETIEGIFNLVQQYGILTIE